MVVHTGHVVQVACWFAEGICPKPETLSPQHLVWGGQVMLRKVDIFPLLGYNVDQACTSLTKCGLGFGLRVERCWADNWVVLKVPGPFLL